MNGKIRWVQRKTLTLEQANQMLPKVFHVPVLQAYDEGSGKWVDVPQAQEDDDGIDERAGSGG